jgi:two-component system nitrate/nitrite response regulator NarL
MKESSFPLSEREREVLQFVAKGLSNKEIAVSMRISPSTVKRHVENILRKLQLKNRVEASVYAVTKAAWATEKLAELK